MAEDKRAIDWLKYQTNSLITISKSAVIEDTIVAVLSSDIIGKLNYICSILCFFLEKSISKHIKFDSID